MIPIWKNGCYSNRIFLRHLANFLDSHSRGCSVPCYQWLSQLILLRCEVFQSQITLGDSSPYSRTGLILTKFARFIYWLENHAPLDHVFFITQPHCLVTDFFLLLMIQPTVKYHLGQRSNLMYLDLDATGDPYCWLGLFFMLRSGK